jgi:hypothetical protein
MKQRYYFTLFLTICAFVLSACGSAPIANSNPIAVSDACGLDIILYPSKPIIKLGDTQRIEVVVKDSNNNLMNGLSGTVYLAKANGEVVTLSLPATQDGYSKIDFPIVSTDTLGEYSFNVQVTAGSCAGSSKNSFEVIN